MIQRSGHSGRADIIPEAEPPQLLVEGAPGYAEKPRGRALVPSAEGEGTLETLRNRASSVPSLQDRYTSRPAAAVAHMLGQHAQSDRSIPAQVPQPLEEIEELPDVPGPLVALQASQGSLLDEDIVPPGSIGSAEVIGDEGNNILPPLPEGRDMYLFGVYPVIEILPERCAFELPLDILVRRRYYPYVNRVLPVLSDSPDRALLEDTQQLHLLERCELADLIEEERAAVRLLEDALAIGHGAGEASLSVAEKLALKEMIRYGGAVDCHEGPIAPLALIVHKLRNNLLTRAGLPHDEYGPRTLGGEPCMIQYSPHSVRYADKAVVQKVCLIVFQPNKGIPHGADLALADALLPEGIEPGEQPDRSLLPVGGARFGEEMTRLDEHVPGLL